MVPLERIVALYHNLHFLRLGFLATLLYRDGICEKRVKSIRLGLLMAAHEPYHTIFNF